MRKISLAASCGVLVLLGVGGAFALAAESWTPPRIVAENAPLPERAPEDQKVTADPSSATVKIPDEIATASAEDLALRERLRDLIQNNLQQYVVRPQDRNAVEAFYQKHIFQPLWAGSNGRGLRTSQTLEFLHGVAADGLNPKDYPTPNFADQDPSRQAADELFLTNSVLTFVRHAATGRIAFSRVSGSIYFDRKAPDPEQVLDQIVSSDDVRDTLDSFNPQQPQYKKLKAALATAREVHSGELNTAVSNATRVPGHANEAKVDTILANMERWRWEPRELGSAYVMVNIPDYTLEIIGDGKTVWTTRVVVGKPGEHATPLLAETMKYITFNPTWNVPPSIIRNEYLPALERDPTALARIGLRVGRNSDGSIRIYQPPSERNALGRVRFNFPNPFLVYQHDTPDKYLFNKTVRAYSHGCMRVEHPDQYAEILLSLSQPEDGYTIQRIHTLYGGVERNVNLKTPIPVYLTYQTAFIDDSGRLQTRSDIYGLDKEIVDLLKRDSPSADVPIARNYGGDSKPVTGHTPSRHRYEVVEQPYNNWDRTWDPYFSRGGASSYYGFDRRGSW
jgi:L,D-transpeptidase YcbB